MSDPDLPHVADELANQAVAGQVANANPLAPVKVRMIPAALLVRLAERAAKTANAGARRQFMDALVQHTIYLQLALEKLAPQAILGPDEKPGAPVEAKPKASDETDPLVTAGIIAPPTIDPPRVVPPVPGETP